MGVISLTEKDFLAGESQWDYLNNGGFSPDSNYLNLFLKPGVLNFGQSATDRGGATLLGNVVASAYDKNFPGNDSYHVDDQGNFYTVAAGVFTKRQTCTNVSGFQLGTTDMIQFQGNTYATYNGANSGFVAQLAGSNLTGIVSDWWLSGLQPTVRHPLEVVEDKLYIGNQNVVLYYDGTTSGTAVTLPTDCNITSLRRHPDGRHLIAFTSLTLNFSHTAGGPGKIYVINKDTQQWEREILIDTQVEGSRTVGGIVYVTYGKKLGYFTGSGIKFLKQLKTSTTTYSQSMGNFEDFLLVRDGTNALAYGDLGNGKKTWNNFFQGATINNLFYKGNGVILIGTASATLLELDFTAAGINGRLVTKRYIFPSSVKITRIEFIHDQKSSVSIFNFNVNYRDTDDTSTLLASITWPVGSTPNRTRVDGVNLVTDAFQMILTPLNGTLSFKAIHIYFDGVNAPVNN